MLAVMSSLNLDYLGVILDADHIYCSYNEVPHKTLMRKQANAGLVVLVGLSWIS